MKYLDVHAGDHQQETVREVLDEEAECDAEAVVAVQGLEFALQGVRLPDPILVNVTDYVVSLGSEIINTVPSV